MNAIASVVRMVGEAVAIAVVLSAVFFLGIAALAALAVVLVALETYETIAGAIRGLIR